VYVLVGSDVIDDTTQEDDAEVALFSIFQFEIQQPNFDLGEQSFFTLPYQPRSDQSSIFDIPTRLVIVDPDAYIIWPSSILLTKGEAYIFLLSSEFLTSSLVPYDDRILDLIEEPRFCFTLLCEIRYLNISLQRAIYWMGKDDR